MAGQVEPRSSGIGTRIVVGIVALIAVWLIFQMVLGAVFAFIRMGLFVVLFGIVAWVVLVGPPEFGKKR
jgi:hypothetical protein